MKATTMLRQQHREVRKLFGDVKKTFNGDERRTILAAIEEKLRGHMMVEQHIFYPAVAGRVTPRPEAHHAVQIVLDELLDVDPDDERFEAKMTVLEEIIQRHVEEDENVVFPAADRRLGDEALAELAERMQAALDGAESAPEMSAAPAPLVQARAKSR